MNARAVIADDQPQVRPSARIKTVARLLDDEPSQIRRMIARGQLEAHREGKRGVRVYLDSVAAWQEGNPVKVLKDSQKKSAKKARKRRSKATTSAHNQAKAHLRALGLV